MSNTEERSTPNEMLHITTNGNTVSIPKGTSLEVFHEIMTAVQEDRWEDIPDLLVPRHAIEKWMGGKFTYDGKIKYNGHDLPYSLNSRILTTAERLDDPTNLLAFWEKLQENPSFQVVERLWDFLSHTALPISDEGFILAFMGVDAEPDSENDPLDDVVEYPRNKVSDDPSDPWPEGPHAGSIHYATRIAGPTGWLVTVYIHPRDVVCITDDLALRCCRYEVGPDTSVGSVLDDEEWEEPLVEDSEDTNGVWKEQPHKWSYLDEADESGLWDESIRTLRRYARHTLKIVGASKLRGGKEALINRIIEVRGY